jgi:putative thioredoxin
MPSKDATAVTFDTEVLEASRGRGVVVDFWAPWCGPCHQLSPLLERVAARHPDVDLVKVNVDDAPQLAAGYGIRGIPAVKGFRDGKVVSEFTGVQPEAVVERLFAALAPSEADRLVSQADGEAAPPEQERLLRAALDADPTHTRAGVALAQLLAADGGRDEAISLLQRFPTDEAARRLLAELSVAEGGVDATELEALRTRAADGDGEASLRLGRALAAAGRHEEALQALLEAVADPETREEARTAILEVFAVLGDDHELVQAFRPRLAAKLF